MSHLEDFCKTLSQLSDTVKTISDIEQRRVEAAAAKQHGKIQDFANEEQAAILSLRGLEQRRQHQAESLGWKGLTFRQILEVADAEQKKVLLPRFTELDERVSLLKEIRKSADRIMGVRIRELEDAIAVSGGVPGGAASHHFHDRYV